MEKERQSCANNFTDSARKLQRRKFLRDTRRSLSERDLCLHEHLGESRIGLKYLLTTDRVGRATQGARGLTGSRKRS